MPAVFTYTMSHDIARFAQIAVRVWNIPMNEAEPEQTAKAGIEALRQFLVSIGMPRNFEELGAKKEDIPKLAHTACYGGGGDGFMRGFTTLSKEDVEHIYELML